MLITKKNLQDALKKVSRNGELIGALGIGITLAVAIWQHSVGTEDSMDDIYRRLDSLKIRLEDFDKHLERIQFGLEIKDQLTALSMHVERNTLRMESLTSNGPKSQKQTRPKAISERAPEEPAYRKRTVEFGHTNDHCAGAKNIRWHVLAAKGWEIDVNSIQVNDTVLSSKSSYGGVTEATKEGFYIVGRVVNRGNCVKAFGNVLARDARGSLRVRGTYVERRVQ